MEVLSYELPPIGTNAYLMVDGDRGEALLFDAPLNAFPTIEKVLVERGLKLVGLILTHGHWDHTLDVWRFNEFGTPVYAHKADKEFIENPKSMSAFSIPGLEMKGAEVQHWIKEGDELDLIGQKIKIHEVPGHSPGSILSYFPKADVAVSGDAIFQGSIGRTDFPGCSFELLEKSIRTNIYTLPDSTRLLPGHGPETSVAYEKQNNPFVPA